MKKNIILNVKNLLLIPLIVLLILTTNILGETFVVHSLEKKEDSTSQEETKSAPEDPSNTDNDSSVTESYDKLNQLYSVKKEDRVPAQLWLDHEKKSDEKFNQAVLTSLKQTSIDSVTVEMLVEEIKTLDLSDLGLDIFPGALFFMSSLEDLDLSGNNLILLDFGDSLLFSLENLNLSNNKTLQSVNTFALSSLNSLNLSGCNLVSQSTFSVNKEIESINISNNNITAIKVTGLTKLKDLDISNNVLRFLDLTALTSLEKVDASNNKLSAVNFSQLSSLSDLNLSSNFLTTVPNISSTALAAGKLDLSNNQITEISPYLNSMGIGQENSDFSDNLLDSALFENQKQLIIKEGIKVTVLKNFKYEQVLEKIKPYLALLSGKDKETLYPLSPNLGLITTLQDNADTKEVIQTEISKNFSAAMSIALSTAKQPEGIDKNNTQAVLDINFTSADAEGIKVDGEPYSLISPVSLVKTTTTSEQNIVTPVTSQKNEESKITSSTAPEVPKTGEDDFSQKITVILIISVLFSVIFLLTGLRRKQK